MIDQMRLMQLLDAINKDGSQDQMGQMPPDMMGQSPMNPSGPVGPQEPTQPDIMKQLQELFSPREEQFNRLSELIGQMPQRQDFKPSFGRRLAAIGANLGTSRPTGMAMGSPVGFDANIKEGLDAQNAVLDQPYNRAMGAWKEKGESLGKLAQIEGSRNTNDRLIGSSMLSNERARATNQRLTDKNISDADLARERIKTQREANEIRRLVAEQPNYKPYIDENEMLILYDGKSGEIKETGIKTDKWDEADKLAAQVEGRITLAELQNKNRLGQIAASGAQSRLTKEVPSSAQTTKGESSTQKQTRQFMRAQEAINTHPDWAPYITLQQGKTFVIKAPEGRDGLFGIGARTGGDPKVVDEINKFIYEPEPNVSPQSSGAKTGKVMMMAPDGKTVGYVPQAREAEYIKNGYSRVKPR